MPTHFVTDDSTWLAARKADAEREFTGPVRLAAPGARFEVTARRGLGAGALPVSS